MHAKDSDLNGANGTEVPFFPPIFYGMIAGFHPFLLRVTKPTRSYQSGLGGQKSAEGQKGLIIGLFLKDSGDP